MLRRSLVSGGGILCRHASKVGHFGDWRFCAWFCHTTAHYVHGRRLALVRTRYLGKTNHHHRARPIRDRICFGQALAGAHLARIDGTRALGYTVYPKSKHPTSWPTKIKPQTNAWDLMLVRTRGLEPPRV